MTALFQQLDDSRHVVGRHQDRHVGHALRHARRGRPVIVRGSARSDGVVPAVEMADEAHDLVLAGMGARETNGHVRGLGAGGREAHLLG
jgi:hypothetical protein